MAPERDALISMDTQGGVQPYLALLQGLRRAGREVLLIAPENYAPQAARLGIPFAPLPGNVEQFLQSPEAAGIAERGFVASHRFMLAKAKELLRTWMTHALAACQGATRILTGVGGFNISEAIAERLGVPLVQVQLQPLTPTSDFPGPMAPGWFRWLGRSGNRMAHQLTRQVMWQPLRPMLNAVRRELLGLGPADRWGRLGTPHGPGGMVLYGYSRHVLPRPREWGRGIHVTGYWTLPPDANWTPPEALRRFVEQGPPPVVIGFGSMSSKDAEATTNLLLAAIRKADRRAVLLSGWGGLREGGLPESVFATPAVPHTWLYPRASVVVHHGGAGTTGAGFQAGVPAVVVPFSADQPFWGRTVAARGCGPEPIPRRRLTLENLADAIDRADREPTRTRARQLGEAIRREDGVARAVEHLLP